jgi:hypothetical protein
MLRNSLILVLRVARVVDAVKELFVPISSDFKTRTTVVVTSMRSSLQITLPALCVDPGAPERRYLPRIEDKLPQ